MSALHALAAFIHSSEGHIAPSLTTFVINILTINKALSLFFPAVLFIFVRRLSRYTRSFCELLCVCSIALSFHL